MAQRYWVVGGNYCDCGFSKLEPGSEKLLGPYPDAVKART
jgi:hypothetical protein